MPITCTAPSLSSEIRAMLTKPAITKRLRENPTIEQLEQIPLASTTFSLKVPEDPALCAGFERVELDLDIPAHTVLPVLGPRVDSARLACAGADIGRAGETTFHARAGCEAIQIFGAVGDSARPLADNRPFIRCSVGFDLLIKNQC